MSWTRLLKRVFGIDIEQCPNCGGALKIIACPERRRRAAIEDPPVIDKILSHLGLPTRAPAPDASAASRSIPNHLNKAKPLAKEADGAARSEFDRAADFQPRAHNDLRQPRPCHPRPPTRLQLLLNCA
jgi:hypothetical protein